AIGKGARSRGLAKAGGSRALGGGPTGIPSAISAGDVARQVLRIPRFGSGPVGPVRGTNAGVPGLAGDETMTLQSATQAIPIGVPAIFSAALAGFAWRRRAMPMAPAFATMMTGETVWALGAALEPVVVELPIKRLCIDLRILGTLVALLGLFAFVLRYTG